MTGNDAAAETILEGLDGAIRDLPLPDAIEVAELVSEGALAHGVDAHSDEAARG